MRFRLLEAPALSAKSWKDSPQPALGSASRSSKPAAKPVSQGPGQGSTFVPTTPEEWEQVLYNKNTDRAVREIACVKWLENNKPSSPLLSLLGELRSSLRTFDSEVTKNQDEVSVEEDKTTHAVKGRALDQLKTRTEKVRTKLSSIFTAIFIAIDCKSDLFENVITKLDLRKLPETYYGNLVSLAKVVAEDKAFETDRKYLLDLSLYSRLAQEFTYTLKVFDAVHDPAKLKKYYDPKKVDVKHLYNGEGIKPAGISKRDPDDFSAIYGVLEMWKDVAPTDGTPKKALKAKEKGEYEFSSFEEAEKKKMDTDDNVITINGKFKFNGDKKKWEPLKA